MIFDVEDFRAKYPEMVPYVGEEYEQAQAHHCALLVIGESHYLPVNSTAHQDCNIWYASDHSKLNEEERGWISTKEIITEELPYGFPNKAHGIWKNGYQKINEYGPRFDDYRTLFKYTVFYNFYLRPANEGNTFKQLYTNYDNEVANAYFKYMVETYKPNGIIFLSRLAFECCSEKKNLNIPVAGAPHPTCFWWNKQCGKYGGRFGHQLIQDGLTGLDWGWAKAIFGH